MKRPMLAAAFFAGAALWFTEVARAEPQAANIAVARKLFGEAAQLREEGKWADAAAKLREAITIKETPGLRFHLAHCEEELGQLVAAEADYDRAAELITDAAKAPDVASLLPPARAALHERVPSVVIRPASGLDGVRLLVDGKEVSPKFLGERIDLDPGSHSLRLEAHGRLPWTLTLALQEQESRTVFADPGRAPNLDAPASNPQSEPASAPPDAVTRPRGRVGAREVVLIAEAALTAAGVTVGTIFAVRYSRADTRISGDLRLIDARATARNEKPSDECSIDSNVTCRDLAPAYDELSRDRSFAIAGFVGAGVGVASLLTTWFLWPRETKHSGPSARVVPTLGGAVVSGAF
jgi:hypothetical protein